MRQPSFQVIPFAATLLAGALLGSLLLRFAAPPPPPPPRVIEAPSSWRGTGPALAPNGALMVFESLEPRGLGWLRLEPFLPPRDPRLLVIVDHIGPRLRVDKGDLRHPRFTPDGSSVVFTRTDSSGPSVWIASHYQQGARRLVANAFDADPAPDGRWIAFLRSSGSGDSIVTSVIVSDTSGREAREIHRESGARLRAPRWSPDGRHMIVTRAGDHLGLDGQILLLGIGEPMRTLAAGSTATPGAWADAKRYVYAVTVPAESPWGDNRGSSLRVHHVKRDRWYEGAWVPGFVEHVDALPGGRLVAAVRSDSLGPRFLYVDRIPGLGAASQ